MSIELNPVGMTCNIACTYCFEHSARDAGNFGNQAALDREAVARQLKAFGVGQQDRQGHPVGFSLHGGEATLMNWDDLTWVCEWARAEGVPLGLQTNGTLLSEAHLQLFQRYNVHIGISFDGPGDLNDARWAGSQERTREQTAKTEDAIRRIQAAGMPHSFIITLHRGNAIGERLERLVSWLHTMAANGTKAVRLHTLEVNTPLVGQTLTLTPDEQFHAFERLATAPLQMDIFQDIRKLLMGEQDVTCVWNACDPLSTSAVLAVSASGHGENCGRVYKDGIIYGKADRHGSERQLALYQTPQEDGGCLGCQWWVFCQGHCPGEGIDGDWRNRSASCDTLKRMFVLVEDQLISEGLRPKSRDIDWLVQQESTLLDQYAGSRRPTVNSHGDIAHGDRPHGDRPHGDGHGDHYDAA